VQFVSDGVFYAELNEMLTRELAKDGYFGVEVRVTATASPRAPLSLVHQAVWLAAEMQGSSGSRPRCRFRLSRSRDGRGRWVWPRGRRILPPLSIPLLPNKILY
jgi:hypothetical protein